MYVPLSPILAADNGGLADAEAQAVIGRLDAICRVLLTLARLAARHETSQPASATPAPTTTSNTAPTPFPSIDSRAGLLASLAALPASVARSHAQELDTQAIVLHAGLLALDRARSTGQMNRAALAMLQDEASARYRTTLAAIDGVLLP